MIKDNGMVFVTFKKMFDYLKLAKKSHIITFHNKKGVK